jgi:hypothetical protein
VQKAFLQSLTLALRLHNAGFLKRFAKPSGRAKFQIEYPLDAIGKACAVAQVVIHSRAFTTPLFVVQAILNPRDSY